MPGGLAGRELHHLIYRGRAAYTVTRALRPYRLDLFGPACASQVVTAILEVIAGWP